MYVTYLTMSYHFVRRCFLWETFPANPGQKHGWIEGGWRWENIVLLRNSRSLTGLTVQGDALSGCICNLSAVCFTLYPSPDKVFLQNSYILVLLLYFILILNSTLMKLPVAWFQFAPCEPLPCLYTASPTDKISGVWHEVLGLGFLGCWDLLLMVPLKGRMHSTKAAVASDWGNK